MIIFRFLLPLYCLYLCSCINVHPWQTEYNLKACIVDKDANLIKKIFGKPIVSVNKNGETMMKWSIRPFAKTVSYQDPLYVDSYVDVSRSGEYTNIENTVRVSGGNVYSNTVISEFNLYVIRRNNRIVKIAYFQKGHCTIPIVGNDSNLHQFAKLMEICKEANTMTLEHYMKNGHRFSDEDLTRAAIEAIKEDNAGIANWLVSTYGLNVNKKVRTWIDVENDRASYMSPISAYLYGSPVILIMDSIDISIKDAITKFKAEKTSQKLSNYL